MIKSFRGKLADGEIQKIKLSTKQGLVGYRISKFELVTSNPGGANAEHCVKVFTTPQDTATNTIDFSDPTLLAIGLATNAATGYSSFYNERIVFDSMTFNQDIYISYYDTKTNDGQNYMVELEQVKLDLSEATVATLKDMRGRE